MTNSFTKQGLLVLVILISLAGSYSFAQDATLGDLVVRFCNDETVAGGTSSLSTTAKGGKEEDICMLLSNGGLSPVTIKVNFVDGTITNDSDQKKACQPESTKDRFGKYISMDKTEYRLQPQQSIEVHATAKFPVSYAGMSYGCVTYQAVGESEGGNGMFNVLTRKANFIDILVEGKIELGLSIKDQSREDNIGKSNQLIIFKDITDGHYKGQLVVTNDGNIAQQVVVGGSVNARFQNFPLPEQSKKVLPGDSVDFVFPIDDYVPRYDGVITANVDLTNTPVFEFESDQITEDMRKASTQTLSSSIFIAPWKLLAALIAIFLLLFAGSRYMKNRSGRHTEIHTHQNNKAHSKNTHIEVDIDEENIS